MIYGVMLMSDNPILDLTPAWMEFRTQLKCKLAPKTNASNNFVVNALQ